MGRRKGNITVKVASKTTTTTTALPAVATSEVTISPPRLNTAVFKINGISPYMQARFSQKAANKIREQQEAGSPKGKKERKPRDFTEEYEGAKYISEQGWNGMPAGAFRTAMIDCCRLVNFKMTFAKLAVFIEADGFDKLDGTPLVKINGEPTMSIEGVRNATGVLDLRARPQWREWSADLRVRFDEDQFSLADVTNLLSRVGLQCGVGECRPNSRDSTGKGFGLFKLQAATA
jgi:hypothetical protein